MQVSVISESCSPTGGAPGGRLSVGAIGGIVGGIIGAFLVAATFYFLGRQSRVVPVDHTNSTRDGTTVETSDEEELGTQAPMSYVDVEVGGRLRYPNELVDEGGRLGMMF